VAGVQVKGDLIPNTDGRIMTRSRARISKPRYSTPSSFERNFHELAHEARSKHKWIDKRDEVPSWFKLCNALLPFSAAFAQSVDNGHNLTAQSDPDQYTIIPANLKILKVLIVELGSASGASNELDSAAAADLAEEGEDDGDWEDEPNAFLDLGSGLSKEQLMAYAADDGPGIGRQKDDETQAFLVDFFKRT
jgi:hypothetical protein